jgi:hypothetical protein
VHVTGTDIDGNAVDQTIFLAYSGVDVELTKGTYHAEVVGSPITSAGVIYEIPSKGIDFTLDDDLAEGEEFRQPVRNTFVLTPIAPDKTTDEAVKDAIAWARKDEQSNADVGKLEAAIEARRKQGTEQTDATGGGAQDTGQGDTAGGTQDTGSSTQGTGQGDGSTAGGDQGDAAGGGAQDTSQSGAAGVNAQGNEPSQGGAADGSDQGARHR